MNFIDKEKYVKYFAAPNQECVANYAGSSIVLGKDMPSEHRSGAGGRLEEKCSSIDIVAGRVPYSQPTDEEGLPLWCYNDFKYDAARIYISQKTNIDEYFNIPDGNVGESRDRSAIAVKADAVRIIGREGVKIVTKTEIYNSQPRAGSTYQNPKMGTIQTIPGIDLIAGANDSEVSKDLQPIPKGNNLASALNYLFGIINYIAGNQEEIAQKLENLFVEVKNHKHALPPMQAAGAAVLAVSGEPVALTSQAYNPRAPGAFVYPPAIEYARGLEKTIQMRRYGTFKNDLADIRIEIDNNRDNYLLNHNSGQYVLSKYNRVN